MASPCDSRLTVNIKNLPIISDINNGDFIIVETSEGTNILDFRNFLITLDNTTFKSTFLNHNTQFSIISSLINSNTQDISANKTAVNDLTTQVLSLSSNVSELSGAIANIDNAIANSEGANVSKLAILQALSSSSIPSFPWRTLSTVLTAYQTIPDDIWTTVNNLYCNITRTTENSYMRIQGSISVDSRDAYTTGIRILRNNTPIGIGNEVSGYIFGATAVCANNFGSVLNAQTTSFDFVDTLYDVDSSNIYYTVQVRAQGGAYINSYAPESWNNNSINGLYKFNPISTFTVTELV